MTGASGRRNPPAGIDACDAFMAIFGLKRDQETTEPPKKPAKPKNRQKPAKKPAEERPLDDLEDARVVEIIEKMLGRAIFQYDGGSADDQVPG